jgi:hypothetical protein
MGAVRVGVAADGLVGESAGQVPGHLGGFGGVLGQVGGDVAVGDLALRGDGDHLGVDVLTPGDAPALGPGRVRAGGVPGHVGGVVDGVDQVGGVQPGRRQDLVGGGRVDVV